MNRKNRSRALSALLGLLMFLACTGAGFSGAEGALPLDFREGGKPPKAEGWTFNEYGPVSYEDSTIQVTFEREMLVHEVSYGVHAGEQAEDEAWIVRIKIRDASQLRTAVARDSYAGKGKADAAAMANSKNAVVAIDGDYFKYENDTGYVVRQGELIRDATDNGRGRMFDMLLIDSEGDFHVLYSARTDTVNAYAEEVLAPAGRTILNTFNFGPVLVENGRVPTIAQSEVGIQDAYDWRYPNQRICIAQTGPLEYAVVEVAGKGQERSGLTIMDFADYVQEKVPDAIIAYNLDGGGSTALIARKEAGAGKGEMICRTPGQRDLVDILYFASAED